MTRTKRLVFSTLAVTSATALLAGCAAGNASPESGDGGAALSGDVIWADFGGPTNEARQAAYFDPFTEATGVEVVSVAMNDTMQESMASGGPGDYDAIHVGLDLVYPNTDTLTQIPEEFQDEELPEAVRPYAFGTFFVGHVQGYLTSTFPDGGPQNWADFWDVEQFPGKRAWPGEPASFDSSCEIALLADGVEPEDLYPIDFDRCGEKLDELRPNIVFYTEYPQIQQLLISESVAVAMGPSGQFVGLRNNGEEVTIPWDQAIVAPNVIIIPGQAPNKENVLALTEVFHDPENQALFASRTNYGPGNPAAYDFIPEDIQDNIITAPTHTNVVFQNAEWRGENRGDYVDFFSGWLTK